MLLYIKHTNYTMDNNNALYDMENEELHNYITEYLNKHNANMDLIHFLKSVFTMEHLSHLRPLYSEHNELIERLGFI